MSVTLPPRERPDRALVDAALDRQRADWGRGERRPIDAYLMDCPALLADDGAVLDLIDQEAALREAAGESPTAAEYTGRFPHLAEALRLQFEVSRAFGSVPDETPWVPSDWVVGVPRLPEPGARLAGFVLLAELGGGGMGVVFKAYQSDLARVVAVKLLRHGDTPEARVRFRIEAEAVAKLQHPHIVQIYQIGEVDGRPYLSLEFVEGGDLSRLLRAGPLPPGDAARLLEPLALAVQHAHERGVIHRDLKPANVLLQLPLERVAARDLRDAVPKVSDFGLARRLDDDSGRTRTGAVLGTPAYMAPEQARGDGKAVGPAADVWGLGAILYECLTGRPPFQGTGTLDTLEQVCTREPVAPRRLQPKVPRDLETICLKCLQKEPGRRYASAAALADDLRRFRDGRPVLARRTPWWRAAWKWARRRPAAAALLAVSAAAVLSLALLWIGLNRQFRAEQAGKQVDALALAAPEGVPYAIAGIVPLRDEALPLLRARFADEAGDFQARLHLACALAALGEGPRDFLIDAVAQAPANPGNCANLVAALTRVRDQTLAPLRVRCAREVQPAARLRFAVVLMHLGEPRAARDMLALAADPKSRTEFIHGYATWHGDLAAVPGLLRGSDDAALRSGLCAALGRLDPALLPAQARRELLAALAELYVTADDGGTHAAARYALLRWGGALPELPRVSRPPVGRGWFVNGQGMTMIRIEPGEFTMGDPDPLNDVNAAPHRVTLTRPFYLSDREVSVDLFRQFLRDAAAGARPAPWHGPDAFISPRGDCPVQQVTWHDALLFCNWLSRKEGRRPCYERITTQRARDERGQERERPVWRYWVGTDGYRLPTEAEWEYACRAGTVTKYVYGDGEDLLSAYGTHSSGYKKPTAPGATLLPNGWGLFDMHGNVWEWCWDEFAGFPEARFGPFALVLPRTDPTGPFGTNPLRVARGGGVWNSGGDWRSASRSSCDPQGQYGNVGFRVACGADGQGQR